MQFKESAWSSADDSSQTCEHMYMIHMIARGVGQPCTISEFASRKPVCAPQTSQFAQLVCSRDNGTGLMTHMLEALDLETLPARLRCSMTQMATEQAARHAAVNENM